MFTFLINTDWWPTTAESWTKMILLAFQSFHFRYNFFWASECRSPYLL